MSQRSLHPSSIRLSHASRSAIPAVNSYILANCSVPSVCLGSELADELGPPTKDRDGLVGCDIRVESGRIAQVTPRQRHPGAVVVDVDGGCVFPAFVDLHTHIDKGHTCERSRNQDGSLRAADRSTARDAAFWSPADVFWRMDYSMHCAYYHGTCALRTHLINITPMQQQLTWPALEALRNKWAGKIELQGVALVPLSFFRDSEAAVRLANTVANYGGILGAAVCCTDDGGLEQDDWTTCERDRSELLDNVFELARARGLLLDFHVDENGNPESKGLRHIAQKTLQHSYQGRVVCGHCCSLTTQTREDLRVTMDLVRQADITVVSLPLVNQWTQDRRAVGGPACTPRWRGITALQELQAAGVSVVLASDNTRDQFYAYGDLDMMEVYVQGVRIGQLDRPIAPWPGSVTCVPARAMRLPGVSVIQTGAKADLVLFRGRKYSELLSRPQFDRVVLRGGVQLKATLPDYRLLDCFPGTHTYVYRNLVLGIPAPAVPSNAVLVSDAQPDEEVALAGNARIEAPNKVDTGTRDDVLCGIPFSHEELLSTLCNGGKESSPDGHPSAANGSAANGELTAGASLE